MTRAPWRVPDPLDVAVGHAILAAALGLWAGRVVAALAGLLLDRARARLTLARIDLLKAFGRRDAARRACEAALRRCERRRAALAGLARG